MKKKKKKGTFTTVLLVVIFFVGLSVLLYPTISNWWNQRTQSRALASYTEVVAGLTDEEYDALFAVAEEYNDLLGRLDFPFFQYDRIEEEYYAALDVAGSGIMGYVTIDKIGVELPIYHGTAESVLNVAVGHLEGTSLPTGGESRHCVISAHRGLPRAKLFTDLDKLGVGDLFEITVLNRRMTYQVDQILIVEPEQMEALAVEDGADHCTLMTCTPYGINTHRLFVRGVRVKNPESDLVVTSEARKIDPLLVVPALALPMLMALLGVLLIKFQKKKY